MKKALLLLFIFCSLFSEGQNTLVKVWDKRLGSSGTDFVKYCDQTKDGGYIIGGFTTAGIGGDKTQATQGNYDFWIVKIDSTGNKEWDKDFGGVNDDFLSSIDETKDGGYLLGGISYSGIGGDKTEALWGSCDYWLVKIDSLGNKQWDKDFGGLINDVLISIEQTDDNGFILGGYSYSGIGGDKTQVNWDTSGSSPDYWIIKTDSLGNKQWDKAFGGTFYDTFSDLQQTSDHGYILGGYSESGIGGDKSKSLFGLSDYWIIKIDSLGVKQWDQAFGGNNFDYLFSLQQTFDNGYILGGYSVSGITGNKTQPIWGDYDYWIVKIDSLGNYQWDKDFGGTAREELFKVFQTQDEGYLISGDSYSSTGGDKTENNLGPEQSWILKTNSVGTKQWEKTIFTQGHDESGIGMQSQDGCYEIVNYSSGGIGGYKTQSAWNNTYDFWIVKFCDSTTIQANFTSTSILCPGTCNTFLNLSTNATSFEWSFPGASPNTSTIPNPTNICYANPGNYDVQLIASNANGSDTLLLPNYITIYPSPSPQSITQSGDTLFALAGGGSYQWYFNSIPINGATDYFYVAPSGGDYNAVATDSNGCEVEAAIFNVIANEESEVTELIIDVYPNPVSDIFTIDSQWLAGRQFTLGKSVEISIYNIFGALIVLPKVPGIQAPNNKSETSVDVHMLLPGMYVLEVQINNQIYRAKFVKE